MISNKMGLGQRFYATIFQVKFNYVKSEHRQGKFCSCFLFLFFSFC